MSFTYEEVSQRWPYLYHLTHRQNVETLRQTGSLYCANYFLPPEWQRVKRKEHYLCSHQNHCIVIRDQKPLFPKNIAYSDGASFENILDLLNSRVFFWPGTAAGPNDSGRRHFQRYREEAPVVLRLQTAEILAAHPNAQFCRYNSGAPRWVNGHPSPRGAETFLPAHDCPFSVRQIIEVTIPDEARLTGPVDLSDIALLQWNPF